MSQKSENPKICSSNKGISINKSIDRFIEDNTVKNTGVGSTSSANVVETRDGSSGGAFMTGKKFVAKMKFLKKRLVQAHEYD